MSSLLRQDWIEKFCQLNMDFEKKKKYSCMSNGYYQSLSKCGKDMLDSFSTKTSKTFYDLSLYYI